MTNNLILIIILSNYFQNSVLSTGIWIKLSLENIEKCDNKFTVLKTGLTTNQILSDDILFNLLAYMNEQFSSVANSCAYRIAEIFISFL